MKYILVAVICLAAIIASETRSTTNKQQANAVRNSLLETRVIGGVNSTVGARPYQVSIQNTFDEHVCGGSIIDEHWILTAAHCMEWPKEYLRVATGTNNWKQPRALYNVTEVHVHCKHDKPMYHNDIALLRVDRPITFDNYTQAVTLATSNALREGEKLTLSGWGSTKLWGRYPDTLQEVELQYYPNDKCKTKIKNEAWLGAGHICTYTKAGEGSCHGDSGGPLVHANGTQYGVVNFGEPCAVGVPDAFASVAYYIDWIRTTMAGNSIC